MAKKAAAKPTNDTPGAAEEVDAPADSGRQRGEPYQPQLEGESDKDYAARTVQNGPIPVPRKGEA